MKSISKHIVFTLSYLFLALPMLWAQNSGQTDSLLNLLKNKSLADTSRALLLSDIAYSYLKNAPENTLKYAQKALELAERISFPKGKAYALSQIGSFYWQIGKYPQSMEYYLLALEIEEKIKNKKGIARNLNNIGLIYDIQNDLDKALSYYQQSLAIDKELKEERAIAVTLNNIGIIYDRKKEYFKALDFFWEALRIADKTNDVSLKGVTLNNLGDVYLNAGKLNDAIRFQRQAIDWEQKINDQEGIAYSYNALSTIYIKLGQLDSAEHYAMQAIQINQKLGITPLLKDNYQSIKEIAFQRKDYLKAYWYANATLMLTDSLFSKDKNDLIDQLEKNYELGKKQSEIDALESENIIKEKEIEKQNLRQLIWIIFFGVALAFAFGLFFLSKQRSKTNAKLNSINTKLYRTNRELRDLNATKDKLFSIISHDLRSPFNTLKSTLTLMRINAFSPEEIAMLSSQLEQNVENISYTLENLLQWSMLQMKQGQQTNIEKISLNNIITETIKFHTEAAKNKEIEIITSIQPDLFVSADENQIRFIFRNLLNNAIKFTFPKGKITINTEVKENEIITTFSDTGIGMTSAQIENLFSPTNRSTQGTKGEKGTGLGLLLCKEFAENNSGHIRVTSKLHEGSSFIVSLKIA